MLKPNLAFLQDKPVTRDETIVLVSAPEATKPQVDRSEDGKAGSEGGAFENLALDAYDCTAQRASSIPMRK